MPNPNTQRYIGWIATIGVLASCFGCGLLSQNQIRAALAFMVLAWIILVPTFVYLLRTRRQLKKVVRAREEKTQEQLDALAEVGRLLDPGSTGEQRPGTGST